MERQSEIRELCKLNSWSYDQYDMVHYTPGFQLPLI